MAHHRYYNRMQKMKRRDLGFFVAGFVDGESSFSVSLKRVPSGRYAKGWYWALDPVFQVYQHEQHIDILNILKDHVFMTGRIHRKTSPYSVFTYSVENQKTLLERIVPFFERYELATKTDAFQKFKKVLQKMKEKEHLTKKGFLEILDIAFSMNAQGKQRKFKKEFVLETLAEQFASEESSETTRRAPPRAEKI